MRWLEDQLIYFPERHPLGMWVIVERLVSEGVLEEVWPVAADGTRLHGLVAGDPAAERWALYLHGNAGNASERVDMLRSLAGLGARVLLLDYRGYGKSEGKPSEKGLYADARAAWSLLTGELGARPERTVIFGKSLGGAIACQLASEVEAGGLIVQSSFTSIPAMGRIVLPLVPGFLISQKMNSLAKVPRIACPKLFVHGSGDEVVPYRMGLELFAAASEPKRFHEVPGARHNETWIVGGEPYWEALRGFLHEVAP